MISLENVSVIRNKKHILKDICWEVEKGQHWALLGLNGSGKTTILNIINGYIHPSEGKAEILGGVLGKTNFPELRKHIGLVSVSLQQRIQGNENVLGVVLSGKYASIGLYEAVEKKDVEQAYHYMELLNCCHLEGEDYGALSQGERQRVLIARALMAKPKILILDEPCNGLDIIAKEQLLHFVEKMANEQNTPTIIYVTHHVEEILPCFEHTMLLKEGQVFKQGLTKELLTETTLSSFYNRSVSVQEEQNRIWLALKEKVNI